MYILGTYMYTTLGTRTTHPESSPLLDLLRVIFFPPLFPVTGQKSGLLSIIPGPPEKAHFHY